MPTFSRRKFQEALRACKDCARNPKLPAAQRLRAAELIGLFYGLELPEGSTKRDRKAVRDLIQERVVEKHLQREARDGVLKRVTNDAEIAAQEFLQSMAEKGSE